MSTINDQIDAANLAYIKAHPEGSTNLTLAFVIRNCETPPMTNEVHEVCWMQELADRSCQRLRKKGLIRYDRKRGWMIFRDESAQEDKR